MAVNVRIKQKSLFKKKLDIKSIIKLSNLSYGICDENYRLIENEIGEHTLIYDKTRLARGIDLSLDKTDILLQLSLPTSKEEIRLFYDTIKKICQTLKIQTFIREDEEVKINDLDKFILADEEGSVCGLQNLEEQLTNQKYNHFAIFGVYNPISIGIKEITEINNDLDNFSSFLHDIQSLDIYYAAPKVYKVNNKLVGIYAIGSDIPSVVPTKPYIVLNQIKGVEKWYVMLKEGKTIQYDDFISNIKDKVYYDYNHVIITLKEEDMKTLEKFCCEIN